VNLDKAARFIETLLNQEKLAYRIIRNKNSVLFDNLDIGNRSVIGVVQGWVYLLIQFKKRAEVKAMNVLCDSFGMRFKSLQCVLSKKGDAVLFRLKLPVAKISDFKIILIEIDSEFQRELSPFVLDIVTEKPNTFFVNQYKLWKSIPILEQNKMIEDILILKERYFRTAKTGRGIVNKLNKVKKKLSATYKEKDNEVLEDMLSEGLHGNVYYEFYMIDFAAMFRAIELGLIKLKLRDFFENYKVRRNR